MNEKSAEKTAGEPKAFPLKWALRGVAVAGVAAVVYIIVQASINPQRETELKSFAKGEMAKFVVPLEAAPAPATSFLDAEGGTKRIADFKGQVTVVNLWATWCGPCVGELPGLHKAHEAYRGRGLEVLSLSLDRSPEAIATFRGSQKLPMPWKHAFLEGGMNHPLCQTLRIRSIPRLFLLGPDGTILATEDSLRGEALSHTLEGILGHR